MDSVLGWFGSIFEAILSFVPRIVKIRSTNRGVKFKCGKYPILWEPGLHLYIPAFSDYMDRPVVRQSIELPKQLLFTNDGKQIAIKGIVIFDIPDLFKLITETYDESEILADFAVEIIGEVISECSLAEIKTNRKKIKSTIYNRLKIDLEKYGVNVTRFSLKDTLVPDYNISIWNIDDSKNLEFSDEE